MAELKNYVMATIFLLFAATAMVTIYGTALVNYTNNGGNSTSTSFPLLNQTQGYTTQMDTFAQQLSNTTLSAADQPSASNAFGIGALATIGTGAISLAFSTVTILIGMISSAGASLTAMGIPGMWWCSGRLR